MTRWDTDNLNAAHTQREIEQEFGCNLIDQLREVTGGKLAYTNTSNAIRLNAANRIEQLERELALELHKLTESEKVWMTAAQAVHDQLASEKALADDLYKAWNTEEDERSDAAAAYRKARGL